MMSEIPFPRPHAWQIVVLTIAMLAALVVVGFILQRLPVLREMNWMVACGILVLAIFYVLSQYNAIVRSNFDTTCFAMGICILTSLLTGIYCGGALLTYLTGWSQHIEPGFVRLLIAMFAYLCISTAALLANFYWKQTLFNAMALKRKPPESPKLTLLDLMMKVLAICVVLGVWNLARLLEKSH
ncbi:hypothetical protein AB1L30_05835 [Bremerella sp. JC817]|uniref:hypothetical protein n=1 Tax=Bremerella sp. JC817 TaxID=3231756 RepID=UPI00345800BF